MLKKIQSALISVFYKDNLEPIVKQLDACGAKIYSTGGTWDFIHQLGINCTKVEEITNYPSILGGRVKTLHPLVFGGILGKRGDDVHRAEMTQYNIPEIDLVMVDLYPFEETVANTKEETAIIEKIDIGGPSMIRAAGKNFQDVLVVGSRDEYNPLLELLKNQVCATTLEQRRSFAMRAFDVCTAYDIAISNWFHQSGMFGAAQLNGTPLRYGENPHQAASFNGKLDEVVEQIHGKAISYNNMVDLDAALALIREFDKTTFAIIKHTNVCGAAQAANVYDAWTKALAGDPESAFGGVLVCNGIIDRQTASAINELFFEILVAKGFDDDALEILKSKKNRILLIIKSIPQPQTQTRTLLNGYLSQDADRGNTSEWKDVSEPVNNEGMKQDLLFANILCKHLKSNAIALVKDMQLLGKGCGQTSRVDSLRQAIAKAGQFGADLNGSVLASDAFFPFDDCVRLAHDAGVKAFIQPGGSIRDDDSINYCRENNLGMIITGMRHFRH